MRIYSYSFVVFFLIITTNSKAQTHLINGLISKINSYKKVGYTQVSKQKNPFNDDITSLYVKSSVTRLPVNKGGGELYVMDETRGVKYVYNGSIRMDLDANNKTYEIKDNSPDEPYRSPYYWASFMEKQLKLSPKKVKMLSDTIVGHVNCYHIRYLLIDSSSSRQAYDICLNKTTGLPVYTKEYLKGVFGKGDVLGNAVLTMITENSYSNYRLNPRIFPKISEIKVPNDYNVEKKIAPLQPGNKIPEWKLQNLQGDTVSNKDLQGFLVLMDFSFNSCAACALSLPSLKRLNERYKNNDVKVITVNTSDTKESVIKFVKKNDINYPIFINGKAVSKSFRVSAYPTFYLIDKEGNVIAEIEGYSNDFEKNMISQIEKLNK